MGGTFDGVSGTMSSGLVRGLPLERFGSELLAHARCWVLRGRALVASVGRLVWLVAVSLWAFSWLHRLVGCGEGTARTLRTTQWTRASSSQSFGWLVKMILKIISQFFDDSTHVISSL